MSRPTEEGIVGAHDTTGFSPSATPTTQLNVVAPLDVEAAPQQAAALAQALGHANAAAQPVLDQMSRQEGAADEASGEGDAALGNVDPDKVATVQGYATGAARVKTEQTALQASNDAKAFYAAHPTMPLADFTDDQGNKQPGLASSIDDIFRKAFPAGDEQDPEQAKVMAPILQHTMQEIAGAKTAATIRNTQQDAEDTASALIMHDIQTGSQSFHMDEQLPKMIQVYGGDTRAARDSLVHAVGEAAVSSGKPDVIDTYLPHDVDFGGGATLSPENQAYLDNARNRATVAQNRNNKTNLQSSEMQITTYAAHGNDPTAMLDKYSKMPGATTEFYWSTLDHYHTNSKAMDEAAADSGGATALFGDIAAGTVTSQTDILQRIQATGAKGRVADQLLARASSALGEHNRLVNDDPSIEGMRKVLADTYRPGMDPTGKFTLPDQANQYAGILQDYGSNVRQLMAQGVSPEEAAHRAATQAQTKWGQPLAKSGADGSKLPRAGTGESFATPQGAAAVRAAGTNPDGLRGMTGADLQALKGSGAISADQANLAAAIIKRQRTNK